MTPPAALRDSQICRPLCRSASPTSLFFSAGPRFSASSTVRSNQSSIISSYLNQDVDPSKRWIAVIPLPAVYRSVDSARYAPTVDSASFSLFPAGKSSRSSSQSFIIDIVEILQQYPLTRDLVHDKILFFNKTTSSATICGCEHVLSV